LEAFTDVHRRYLPKSLTPAPVETKGSKSALVGPLGLDWFQWKRRGVRLARTLRVFTSVHRIPRTPGFPVEELSFFDPRLGLPSALQSVFILDPKAYPLRIPYQEQASLLTSQTDFH